MKKLTVLALVAILGFGCASAQRNGGGRRQMSVEQQVSNLKKELNLTDKQTEKITVLYTDFKKKMKSAGEHCSSPSSLWYWWSISFCMTCVPRSSPHLPSSCHSRVRLLSSMS